MYVKRLTLTCIVLLTTGTKWKKSPEVFNQIDTGVRTWAIRSPRYIYALASKKWKKIPGRLYSVVSGKAGVWGIATLNRIYIRLGVTKRRPFGTRWKRVGGRLKQIDSGPKGIVCGVSRLNKLFCRLQICRRAPYGRRWIYVSKKFTYVSIGDYGYWALNPAGQIYFREGVTRSRPQGYKWRKVPGNLAQISAGQHGQVYGVNKQGKMFVRLGVTENRPYGRTWKYLLSVKLWSQVSIGIGKIYSLDTARVVHRANPLVVGGKFRMFYIEQINFINSFIFCITLYLFILLFFTRLFIEF